MQKRGQVSVFIIIGIVALAAIIFVFVLFRSFQEKAREITNPQEYLKSQLNDIKKVVTRCIGDESRNPLRELSRQGGHFNPIRYVNYYGNKTTFLCAKVKDNEPCYNMMFTKGDIDKELRPRLETSILRCINLQPFRENGGYTITTGNFSLDYVFSDKALLISVNYPITLTKGNVTETQRDFTKDVSTNFWKAAKLASEIVSKEARGESPSISEISPESMEFEISRTEVTGGNLYMLVSRHTDDPTFYFAVQT